MAEKWTRAFGRYLKTLRERRGLSLQDVASLSQAFTETLNKGYLSRCENGHQSLAFAKVIALSRIYEIPADVLLERLELDMELDRVGGVETEGKSYSELTQAGSTALNRGYFWEAYGLLRDSVGCTHLRPLPSNYKDRAEQVACAHMNCASAARALGRRRIAFHEFRFIEASGALGPRFQPIILLRLSQCHQGLNEVDLASEYAERALAAAESLGEVSRMGFACANKAHVALLRREFETAAIYLQKAHSAFQTSGHDFECVRTLMNLAQVYFDLSRIGAARRTLVAAERLALSLGQHRAQALGQILMGEIESLEHHEDAAARRWKEAAEIARKLNDKALRFKAEFFLFKQACESGDGPAARALHRRLRKLSFWVPADTPELQGFKQLAAEKVAAIN